MAVRLSAMNPVSKSLVFAEARFVTKSVWPKCAARVPMKNGKTSFGQNRWSDFVHIHRGAYLWGVLELIRFWWPWGYSKGQKSQGHIGVMTPNSCHQDISKTVHQILFIFAGMVTWEVPSNWLDFGDLDLKVKVKGHDLKSCHQDISGTVHRILFIFAWMINWEVLNNGSSKIVICWEGCSNGGDIRTPVEYSSSSFICHYVTSGQDLMRWMPWSQAQVPQPLRFSILLKVDIYF